MKRMMSIAAIALFIAGSSAFACGGCGCSAKKAEKKAESTTCTKEKQADKKCSAESKTACCAKTTEAKK